MQSEEGSITLTDGAQLYFQRVGVGSATVLIPNGIYLIEDFQQFADGRTLVFYDVRNRGRSETVTDPTKLARGIEQDVDDIDAVRCHFGAVEVDLIGHSYVGLTVALYAMRYPAHVRRVVQIGPAQPDAAKKYPPELAFTDATMAEVMAEVGRMMQRPPEPGADPVALCEKFWSVLRKMYVFNTAHAARIQWGRCDLANERNFMYYWQRFISPSIQALKLTAEDFAKATAPVLVVHGNKDRNAPCGGGKDWAMQLPNARLLTVPDAAHAPWIEAPELVLGSIRAFLDGDWPSGAEEVTSLEG